MAYNPETPTSEVISSALLAINNVESVPSNISGVGSLFHSQFESEQMEGITESSLIHQGSPEGVEFDPNRTSLQTTMQQPDHEAASSRKRSVSGESETFEHKRKSNDDNPNAVRDRDNHVQYNVSVNNRFGPLSELDTQIESNRFKYLNETASESIDPPNKIPPIFIAGISNVNSFTKEIKTKVTTNFVADLKSNNVKISANTSTDFRLIVKYLMQTHRSFHTYKDPANKNYSVVFKNVHQSFSEQEIFEDLKQRYPSILNITRLLKDNRPIPVIAAEFSGKEPIETILSINHICNHKVYAEKRKKTQGPIQCQRCLDFGHTKNNCNHTISCAFCTGNHYSVSCPNKNQNPICKNCKGSHKADSRDPNCQYLKDYSEKRNRITLNTKNPTISDPLPPPPIHSHPHFPSLPRTNSIRNFTHINNTTNQTQSNNSHSENLNQDREPRSFLQTMIDKITSYIVNFINSLIPTILSSIQNTVTNYIGTSYGNTVP